MKCQVNTVIVFPRSCSSLFFLIVLALSAMALRSKVDVFPGHDADSEGQTLNCSGSPVMPLTCHNRPWRLEVNRELISPLLSIYKDNDCRLDRSSTAPLHCPKLICTYILTVGLALSTTAELTQAASEALYRVESEASWSREDSRCASLLLKCRPTPPTSLSLLSPFILKAQIVRVAILSSGIPCLTARAGHLGLRNATASLTSSIVMLGLLKSSQILKHFASHRNGPTVALS